MKAWEWKRLPNSDLHDQPHRFDQGGTLQGAIEAWNGLAGDIVKNRLYSAANGGHADYSGNEVYELDLASEAPSWKLLREPTPMSLVRKSPDDGHFPYYLDGRPASTHTYYYIQFISLRQSIFKFGAGSLWGNGNASDTHIDSFSIPLNDWLPEGAWPKSGTGGGPDRPVCKDFSTENIYIALSGKYQKFDPVLGTVETVATPLTHNDEVLGNGCLVDHKRGKVLYFWDYRESRRSGPYGFVLDLTTKKVESITFTGPAAGQMGVPGSYGYYDPAFDSYIVKNHLVDQVLRVDPVTYAVTAIPTTGGGGIKTPPRGGGPYTRFQIFPLLKGYAYYPHEAGAGVWFLATE